MVYMGFKPITTRWYGADESTELWRSPLVFPLFVITTKFLPSVGMVPLIPMQPVVGRQCGQIGRFLKVLCNKFYYKSRPNICDTVCVFLNSIYFSQNCCGYSLGYFLFYYLVTLLVRFIELADSRMDNREWAFRKCPISNLHPFST